ncbi:MAG: RNA pseudouridine synthase [Bacteroidales bacterium]|nr:RNA pseudouridine synthase [Bacteroidales bacterium]
MQVLYEDNHLIIINKTNSEIVQGDKTGDISLDEHIKAYIKQKYNKPGNVFLGVVHRIDRPVSGVVVFARTSKALARMNKLFSEKDVEKIYWAIVKTKPPKKADTLSHFIVRNTKKNKSFASDEEVPDSKAASLDYELLASSDHYHLLKIRLHTGRHHQIRAQMAKIGCPIKGDLKYGFPRSDKNGGISLHARSVSFFHPVSNEKLYVEAQPPDDNLWNAFLAQITG